MNRVVGRDERIAAALESIEGGRSVGIYGPAGVGKTTLARAVVEAVPDRRILWNSVTQAAASVSLGPLAPLVAVAGLEHQQPLELLASISAALRAQLPDAVVVVDDAHLLDDLSATAVRALVDDGVPVVLTVRSGEPVPDAVEATWRDGDALRLDLEALGPDAVVEQIEDMCDGPVDPATATRIFELSRGVPLFVREIVLAGRSTGWLASDGELWRASDTPLPFSGRLRDLIASRLRACSTEEVDALQLVAVAEKVELEAITAIVDTATVVALEDRQLIRVIEAPTHTLVTIDHPIIADVVRHGLGDLRQRSHADRLIRALIGLGSADRDRTVRIGDLATRSTAPDPDLLLTATTAATTVHDFETAVRFARAASVHGGGVVADLAWADAATSARDFSTAESVTRRLLADPSLTSAQRVAATTLLARVLMWGMGRADEAEGLLRSVVVEDEEQQQLLDVELGFFLLNRGDVDLLIGICEPLVTAGVSAAVRLRAVATLASGFALKGAVATVSALVDEHMDEAVAEAEAVPRAAVELTAGDLTARYLAGDAVGTEQDAGDMLQIAEALESAELEGVGQMFLALSLQSQGHVTDGMVAMDRALALFAEHDVAQLAGWAHAARAHLAAIAGDVTGAEVHLAESLVTPHHAFTAYDFDRTMARARIHVALGERRAAIEVLMDGAAEMRALGRDSAEASMLDLASRLGHPVAANRLAELALRAEGTLIPLMAEHAHALAAGDVDRLAAVAAEFEQLSYDLSAADAAADATRTAYASGRSGTAAALAQRASDLLRRCGDATFAVPLPVSNRALDLTERELEVALLAARGLTNKEIADRLSLSRRTVGNHLYRAYAKAGVEGRLGLAEVLRAAGHLRDTAC